MTPRLPTVCALLVASASALGCGGDEPVRVRGGVLRITLDEYALTPQEVSVPPGRLRLVAHNAGRLAHNLKVVVPARRPGEQPEALGGTPTAQPGDTVRGELTLGRPRRLEIVCTLANHDDLGMWGTLVVQR